MGFQDGQEEPSRPCYHPASSGGGRTAAKRSRVIRTAKSEGRYEVVSRGAHSDSRGDSGRGPVGGSPTPGIPRKPDGKPDLTAPAPRGPDGKPDLTGVWNGPVPETDFDPANAQPWVNDLIRQRLQDYHRGRPLYQCLPNGPEADRFAGWKRVLQTPTAIAILNEDLTYRVIHMDGRELEANAAPSWMGYSVGRWDGDTLDRGQ